MLREGGAFFVLLFTEEGLGSGSPHTPKAVTLIESLPRALESTLEAQGGPGPTRPLPASSVFHCGPCIPSSFPRPAALDPGVEGSRTPPPGGDSGYRVVSSCPASLAVSVGFVRFLASGSPSEQPGVFGQTRGCLRDRDPPISPSTPCTCPTCPTVRRNQPHVTVQWQALGTFSTTPGHQGPSAWL